MTEQTSPFGGLAVAEPQTAMLPVDADDDGGQDNRRKLALVGAAAGVLVLLLAAFFLLKGGGSQEAAPLPPHVVPPATSQGDQGGKGAGTADKPIKLPKSYDAPVGRDPFKAMYTAPVQAAPAEGSSTSSTPPKDSGVVTVTQTPDGSSTGTGTGVVTVPGDSPSAAFAPVWIELVKVKGVKSATFVVGYSNGHKAETKTFSKVEAPTNGLRTTFAGVFALLSIQDGTVTLQFGDGTPFDLNKGFGARHFVG